MASAKRRPHPPTGRISAPHRARTLAALRPSALALAALALAGSWLALPALSGAQPPAAEAGEATAAPDRNEIFIDTVDVNVINVDVYVTDDDGNPVTGLTADDFRLFESERPMKITNFYAVHDNQVVRRQAVTGETGADAPAEDLSTPEPVPEDERLSLVIYVDNYNLRPFNRRRVLMDVRGFLRANVVEGDRVMLVSYDRSLHIRRPFTADVESVISELFELDEVSAQGIHSDSERKDTLERIDDSNTISEALSWARLYAESTRNDVQFSIDAIKEISTSLAGMPGRKAILYVSDGLPMIAAEDVYYYVDQKFPGAGALTQLLTYDASRRFRELVAQANSNRVSFYTIDAAGLRVSSSADVSADRPGAAGTLSFIDSVRTQNLQSPLHYLAESTGGIAVVNRNRVRDSLDRIAQDFRSFYSLGYQPAHSGDGRYYTIEVELADKHEDKDWKVRYRAGYRDKTPEAQMNDGVIAALNFPYYSNPMRLDLDFQPERRRSDGNYLVPVQVDIPISSLVLIPQGGAYEARAKIFLAALDENGGMSPIQSVDLPISIPEAEIDEARGKTYQYTITLLMRAGSQKVAVGVRDEVAASNSFISRQIRVGRS